MDTIVITGTDGFFASRLKDILEDKFNVIAVNHHRMDITNKDETLKTINELKPQYVVHSAAISDTGLCEKSPELSYNVNVNGCINMAEACEDVKAKLIVLSSDQVYNGNTEAGPYSENCLAAPNSVYGRHKLEAENAVLKILDNSIILRLTWLFSLPERKKKTNANILNNIIKAAVSNTEVTLSANEYRGITYVYDILDNFTEIIELPKGVYNTGSENNLSTYEVGSLVFRELGLGYRRDEILVKDIDRYKENKRDLRICNKKMKAFDIFIPDTEEGLHRCIKEFCL